MKKLILLFALALISYSSYCQTIVKNGGKVTLADTVQIEIQLDIVRPSSGPTQQISIYTAPGNSGTIQFSVDQVINETDFYEVPAGEWSFFTIKNGRANLKAKASANNQSFKINQ